VGFYRPSLQRFCLRADDGSTTWFKYGSVATSLPVTGDWDGL